MNKAASYTDDLDVIQTSTAVSAGTLTCTPTILDGTDKITIQLNCDTSLTPSGTNGFVVYYNITNNSEQAITVINN